MMLIADLLIAPSSFHQFKDFFELWNLFNNDLKCASAPDVQENFLSFFQHRFLKILQTESREMEFQLNGISMNFLFDVRSLATQSVTDHGCSRKMFFSKNFSKLSLANNSHKGEFVFKQLNTNAWGGSHQKFDFVVESIPSFQGRDFQNLTGYKREA